MNRDKRHFVHEYCEHFGCESVAYDQEPKRNVVATAARDKVINHKRYIMKICWSEQETEYFFMFFFVGLVT